MSGAPTICFLEILWPFVFVFKSEGKAGSSQLLLLIFSTDNSGGTCSYSITPDNDTRLVRLRKPILEWLRKKLDGPSQANWEALADAHGWKYDDIRAHLTECRLNQVSPFLKLLETENFYTYTISEFLKDMKQIKRLDIFLDFDSVIQNNSF